MNINLNQIKIAEPVSLSDWDVVFNPDFVFSDSCYSFNVIALFELCLKQISEFLSFGIV